MSDAPQRSVMTLVEQIAALPDGDRGLFHDLFAVTRSRGSLVPPPEMRAWIERSFGSVGAVQAQTIIKTLNLWTLEGSLFNDLRARRPMERKAEGNGPDAFEESADDPFRHPLTGTPADTFGRVQGQHSITASNVAKYDGLHAVIIFDNPNPLRSSQEQVTDAFETARRWIADAHADHPGAVYPFVMWNCLPRSGASRVHAHLQATLSEDRPYARIELWRRASEAYRGRHGRGYFDDLYSVHQALGLAGQLGAIRWFAHLTPVKEKELILFSPALDEALNAALYRVLRLYIDALGVRAFNVAIYVPPLAAVEEDWSGFPVVVRMVDRGDPGSATNDVASMELFAQPVVASDPWRVASMAREHLD